MFYILICVHYLHQNIRKSKRISGLKLYFSFNVCLYCMPGVISAVNPALVMAENENKQKKVTKYAYLDISVTRIHCQRPIKRAFPVRRIYDRKHPLPCLQTYVPLKPDGHFSSLDQSGWNFAPATAFYN